jgi:hypothetical protein
MVHYLLLIVALICCFLGFVKYRDGSPVSIGWLGLAFWILDTILFGAGVK